MNMLIVWLVVGMVMSAIVVVGLICQYIYLIKKARKLAEQNEKLRRDNIGLMKHNGKLFDENLKFKNRVDTKNIPTFDEW